MLFQPAIQLPCYPSRSVVCFRFPAVSRFSPNTLFKRLWLMATLHCYACASPRSTVWVAKVFLFQEGSQIPEARRSPACSTLQSLKPWATNAFNHARSQAVIDQAPMVRRPHSQLCGQAGSTLQMCCVEGDFFSKAIPFAIFPCTGENSPTPSLSPSFPPTNPSPNTRLPSILSKNTMF